MTDKVKQLAPIIWEEIKKANKILLSFHRGPDGDSFGSNLALYSVLKKLNKEVTVISGDSSIPNSLKAFPNNEIVLQKNILEIDLKDFDLFITTDTANYEQISRKGKIIFPEKLTVVVIDHHLSNPGFGKINLVDSTYPATCQLLYDLFVTLNIEIDSQIALCLYLGILDDTFFKYPGTTTDTFEVAANLAKINPNFPKAVGIWEKNLKIKSLEFWSLASSKTESCFNHQVTISAVSLEEINQKNIPIEVAVNSEIATIIRSVEGTELAIAAFEREPGLLNVSLRSYNIDVSKLAVSIGGGGHAGAGGGIIKLPFKEAKIYLLRKIEEIYPELGSP